MYRYREWRRVSETEITRSWESDYSFNGVLAYVPGFALRRSEPVFADLKAECKALL